MQLLENSFVLYLMVRYDRSSGVAQHGLHDPSSDYQPGQTHEVCRFAGHPIISVFYTEGRVQLVGITIPVKLPGRLMGRTKLSAPRDVVPG